MEAERSIQKATAEFGKTATSIKRRWKLHVARVAQIQRQFAGSKRAVASGVRELERAREQEAALRAQLETCRQDHVSAPGTGQVRTADRGSEGKGPAQRGREKSVLANEQALRQQLELNAGLADQITLKRKRFS